MALSSRWRMVADGSDSGARNTSPSVERAGGRRSGGAQSHGVTEGRGKAVEDGGLPEKVADRPRLPLQHLGDEVAGDVAVVAGERGDELAGVARVPLQGEGGKLETRDPSLGAGLEGGDGIGREVQAHGLVEERGGLFHGKAQVALADLGDLAPGAPLVQGQGRVLPGVDGGVHQGRLAFEEKAHDLVHRFRGDELVVVEDEGEGAGGGGDVVDQGGDQAVDGSGACRGEPRRVEHRLDGAPDAPVNLLQGRDEVVEELDRVVVTLVEGNPGDLARAGADPLGDEGSLAKAGRRGDEREPVAPPGVRRRGAR